MRGSLYKEILLEISRKIPSLEDLQQTVLRLTPDLISIRFPPESTIPIASVCFHDTLSALEEANYALHEVFASRIWYLEKCNPPNEDMAIFLGKFYIDDVILRLYSAGEHLAEGISNLLSLEEEKLKQLKGKKTRQQIVVGNFLKTKMPSNPITQIILRLADSIEWQKTLDYRGKWVHNQPPLIKGFGIAYKREKRWQKTKSGKAVELGIGGGDIPNLSVDDLISFTSPSMLLFTEVFTEIVKLYIQLLEKNKISFDEKGRITVSIFGSEGNDV